MPSHQMARLQFYLLFVPIIADRGQFNSIISSIQPDSLKFLNEIVEITLYIVCPCVCNPKSITHYYYAK